jgi:hypothetical protein
VSAGQSDAAALERAASQLEDIARRITLVAQGTQDYQRRITPIAQGVDDLVGGSATGRDKDIAALLASVTREVSRSASSTYQAAQLASGIAAQARTEARDLRRQQDAPRQPGQARGR